VPPLLGALLAIVFWGISFVATKAVVGEISPLALILVRTTLGTAFLLAVLAGAARARAAAAETRGRAIALMGFVGVAFHQLLQAYALTLTSAVNTGWLIGLTPVWSALLARVWSASGCRPRRCSAWRSGSWAPRSWSRAEALRRLSWRCRRRADDLLILLQHAQLGALQRARAADAARARLDPRDRGCVPRGAPAAGASGRSSAAPARARRLSPAGWAAVLFLGICCSGLGYLFWYRALRDDGERPRVAALLYLEPLVTLATGIVRCCGEHVGAATVAAWLLLLAGVGLVQRGAVSDRRHRVRRQPHREHGRAIALGLGQATTPLPESVHRDGRRPSAGSAGVSVSGAVQPRPGTKALATA
jgi:drug/metabolite transporter (DMT)-like permease